MDTSILNTTKKILGISSDYTAFDLDVITHINAVFSTLQQLGLGPSTGFSIEDETVGWDDYISDDITVLNMVKTYVFLRVRLIFDPPTVGYVIDALKAQIEEMEWRLSIMREDVAWVDPAPVERVNRLDGGGAQRLGLGEDMQRR